MRRLTQTLWIAAVLGVATAPALAADPKKAPATKKAPAKKAPPPKKVVPVSAEKKKVLAELYGGFKFGQTKDEVIGVLAKQLDERYEEKIKATTDVTQQDRLRKEKKAELARVNQSYITFEGKRTGWDVSIIEEEFAHKTGESMLDRWENKDGKNQRRFFFFRDGRLWKMFISLDVSILPEDKKNFETFQGVMQSKYGPGDVEPGRVTWRTDEFEVRAVDKLKAYDALALVIEDPRVKKDLLALRESKAEKKPDTNPIIKSVIDPDGKDKVDVKSNNNAVDDVIKAQGGGGKAPKKLWFGFFRFPFR